LKQQEDFDVDHADITDIACFSLADGTSGDGLYRTLCQRSVNCAARIKVASSSSTESRDLSPYEAATASIFPGELHGRFRSIVGGSGCPASLLTPDGPAAAGYACMTLLSPDRDCSPEPETRPAVIGVGSCRYDDSNSSRNCCSGTGHYGCRVVNADRKPQRNNSNVASAERIALVPNCGNAVTGNTGAFTCSKHRNMISLGSEKHGVGNKDSVMTPLQCRSQQANERHKDPDESVVKHAIEIGDVF